MDTRPTILITNDDGVYSEGIKCLSECIKDFANVIVVAPAFDQSGVGLGVTLRSPLQIERVKWKNGVKAWKVNGTPADCIKLGFGVLLDTKPDLIVSGINRGSNAGRTVLYSGTIGGVIEGAFRDTPGIAFSYEEMLKPDYSFARKYILSIVQHMLYDPLPKGTILNVNFPRHDLEMRGIRFAKQGKSYWLDNPDKRKHPEGSAYFWLGGRWDDHEEDEESDVFLLKQGFITAVPVHVNELTDYHIYNTRKQSFEQSLTL